MKNKLKWMMAVGMLSCSVAMAQQQSCLCLLQQTWRMQLWLLIKI